MNDSTSKTKAQVRKEQEQIALAVNVLIRQGKVPKNTLYDLDWKNDRWNVLWYMGPNDKKRFQDGRLVISEAAKYVKQERMY